MTNPATQAPVSTLVYSPALLPNTALPGKRRTRHPILLWLSSGWLALVILLAVTADWLPLADPAVDVGHGFNTPPFHILAEPLGTDGFGRSELSRVIFGARVSLFAACVATCIALAVGLLVGITAGYLRGKVDAILGIVIDSVLAFPGLVLLLALSAVLKPGVTTVIVGLSVLGWVGFARLARANTLRVASSDYVAVSRGLGARTPTTLIREILPQVTTSVLTLAGLVVGTLILAEAGLSFLGLGVQAPAPSWGNMISDATSDLQGHAFLMFIPAAVLFLTIFSINIVGDWLRTRSDATSKL